MVENLSSRRKWAKHQIKRQNGWESEGSMKLLDSLALFMICWWYLLIQADSSIQPIIWLLLKTHCLMLCGQFNMLSSSPGSLMFDVCFEVGLWWTVLSGGSIVVPFFLFLFFCIVGVLVDVRCLFVSFSQMGFFFSACSANLSVHVCTKSWLFTWNFNTFLTVLCLFSSRQDDSPLHQVLWPLEGEFVLGNRFRLCYWLSLN